MTNDRARFTRAAELFRHAAALPPDAQSAYLDEACGDDDALRRDVESLLDAEASMPTCFGDDELSHGAQRRAMAALEPFDDDDDGIEDAPLPERIGPYRVLDLLGEGGMGIVYRAQHDDGREVAVKVIRTAQVSAALQRRFRREARALARLDHPGIARILDVGFDETPAGPQRYIAMEYVAGESLTVWARRPARTRHETLTVLAAIADAVQHAHQKGVIHRDLKPANVIIDHDGAPHVVDFGVARIAGTDDAATTLATSPGQLVGTVQYMSPEQIEASPDDVDTRSDVYALGVVMYEVLAGHLPWALEGRPLLEIVRVLRDRDTPPRRLASVDRAFRGDLDAIVHRAMDPNRERRYQSAREIATDIRRHLDHRPIHARHDSTLYVIGRTLRRYRTPIALGAAVLAVGTFVTVDAVLGRIHRAETESSLTVLDAQERIRDPFTPPDPVDAVHLERAAAYLERETEIDPTRAAKLHELVGLGYLRRSQFDRAHDHLTRALALRQQLPGAAHQDAIAQCEHDLGRALWHQKAYAESESHYRTALALRRAMLASLPPGDTVRRRELEANIASSLNDLASCRRRQGAIDDARTLYLEALAQREALGLDRWVAASVNNLGAFLADIHEWEASLARFEDALRRIVPLDVNRLFVSRTHRSIAECLSHLGRHDEALAAAEDAFEIARAVVDEDHRDLFRCRLRLATCFAAAGAFERAHAELAHLEPKAGPADVATLAALRGRIALWQGRPNDAEPRLRRALDDAAGEVSTSGDRIALLRDYGTCLTALERFDDAERVLDDAWTRVAPPAPFPRDLRDSVLSAQIALYDAWRRPDEAQQRRVVRDAAHPG